MMTEQTVVKPDIEKNVEENRFETKKVKPGGRRAAGGLCLSCRHSHTCTFPVDEDHPVIHCEEFEQIRTVSKKTEAGEQKVSTIDPQEPVTDKHLFLGLCANCDNRRTCIYAHTEGGVWHCEEYK